jgi:hypothetical protein
MKKKSHYKKAFTGALFLLLYACSSQSKSIYQLPNEDLLFMSTSDFSTGLLSAYSIESNEFYPDLLPIHADALLSVTSNQLYVINRLGADNIMQINVSSDLYVNYEQALGSGSNPSGLVSLSSQTILVSKYGSADLVVLDSTSGQQILQKSLLQFADSDSIPEINTVLRINDDIYLTMQLLDRDHSGNAIWPPTQNGLLIKLNASSLEVAASYTLPFTNPVSKIRYHGHRDSLVIAAPGYYGLNYQLDGGVVEFSLVTDSFLTSPLTEQSANYEITDAYILNNQKAIALGNDEQLNSYFLEFNPTTSTITRVIAQIKASQGGYFSDFAVYQNRIYLSDRSTSNPQLRVYDMESLTELAEQAVQLTLPASSLTVFENNLNE